VTAAAKPLAMSSCGNSVNEFPVVRQSFPVPRKFSLLIYAGNSRKIAAAQDSAYKIDSQTLNRKIPCKIPFSREFAWRRARSALRRQPAIYAFRSFQETREWAGNPAFRAFDFVCRTPCLHISRWKSAKVSALSANSSRFAETIWETGSISTAARSCVLIRLSQKAYQSSRAGCAANSWRMWRLE